MLKVQLFLFQKWNKAQPTQKWTLGCGKEVERSRVVASLARVLPLYSSPLPLLERAAVQSNTQPTFSLSRLVFFLSLPAG